MFERHDRQRRFRLLIVASVLAAFGICCGVGGAAGRVPAVAGCPHDGSLGAVTFVRSGILHRVSLAHCVDRVVGRSRVPAGPAGVLRSPGGRLTATIRSSGRGRSAKQTIWILDRRSGRSWPIFSETEYYKTIGPGDTPGPVWVLGWSGDSRWLFFTVDPGGSDSADGLILRVVSSHGGAVHKLGRALTYTDYRTWCGNRLVFTGGGNRIATQGKRLLVAAPPDWRPHPLWNARSRAFGSVACAPSGDAVAVLSQPASDNARFFSTRWQLWRVNLNGSHTLLDKPPPGYADESPHWARNSLAIAFVRERNGYGHAFVLSHTHVFGPLGSLGYSLGYYGHHDWPIAWQT